MIKLINYEEIYFLSTLTGFAKTLKLKKIEIEKQFSVKMNFQVHFAKIKFTWMELCSC